MADIPLQSQFASTKDSGVDTTTTLFTGLPVVSTTLAQDLSDVEIDNMFVVDATGADMRGYAVCESELILFFGRAGVSRIMDLKRGQLGTPVLHTAGTAITLHPFYHIPQSIQDAIINLQTRLIALGG